MIDKDYASYDLMEQDISVVASPGIRPGLSRMAKCLKLLGNPQDKFKAVHVLGTNGKGSTASSLASILTASGLKTALYTSPHLIHMGERLRIDGFLVEQNKWQEAWEEVKSIIKDNFAAEDRPTAFELITAVCFLIMARENVDVAVVEAGMGGRLDATNLLGNVALSLFTTISLDHTSYLGTTPSQIAHEKFAVIRPGAKALYMGGPDDVEDVFIARCMKMLAEGHIFSRECVVRPRHLSLDGVVYDLWTSRGNCFCALETRLAGAYQTQNTALAAFGAVLLSENVFPSINRKSIRDGLLSARWPGRFEVIRLNGKTVILDGAHNPDGMNALAVSLKSALPAKEDVVILMAMMKDKDIEGALEKLEGLPIRKIICTQVPGLQRSKQAKELAIIVQEVFPRSIVAIEPELQRALDEATKDNGFIVICGSLYLIGAIKKIMGS